MTNDEPNTENHEKAEGESNDETDDEELAEAYKSIEEVDDCDDIEIEHPTCEFDNHSRGIIYKGNPDDNPVMRRLMSDVNSHGEVHATVEEHEKELEIRRGTAIMDFRDDIITVDTPDSHNNLVVTMDSIVDWYRPMSAWD